MLKILLHKEPITKQGAKHQFQVKLPETAIEVCGVLVTLNPRQETVLPMGQEGIAIPERGSLWLRIPESRDVFYATIEGFPRHYHPDFYQIPEPGITGLTDWWFRGRRREFFAVSVPVEDTLIEGYYIDHATEAQTDYDLRVYLKLEIDQNQ